MREEQAAYRCIVEELAKQICSGTLCQDAPLPSVSASLYFLPWQLSARSQLLTILS